MSGFDKFTRRQLVAGAGALAGAAFLPEMLRGAVTQDPVLNAGNGASAGREKVPWRVLPFPMKQVRLLPGPCQVAQEANRRYLHTLPVDRLAQARSSDAGRSFLNYAWTDDPFEASGVFFGDYTGIAAFGGFVYGVWTEKPPNQTEPAPNAPAAHAEDKALL